MVKYLLEFRNRLLLLFLSCSYTITMSYLYKEILLFFIIQPNSSYNNSENMLFSPYFIFTEVTEIFYVYMQLLVFISFQIFLFFCLYHIFIFFSFALFKKEYQLFKTIFKLVSAVWFLAAVISHYIIIPLTWSFFLSFQDSLTTDSFNIYFESKITGYFYFYVYFYCVCNTYFQVVSFFFLSFTYLNISLKNIKKFRKLYYFGFVILSTLLSPDILSQLLISIFLILVYEIFIFSFIFCQNVHVFRFVALF